ncbi:MAG: MFS transporter, partial [Gammaproteobacteria bacterium]|nr:MFS transporter [Gammaproteobacteria bacterium]
TSGFWIDRVGWRMPLLTGLVLVSLGSLWSYLASDPLQFILSRALLGAGYGVSLMASQAFVVQSTDARGRAGGLAHLFAGLYGGSLAGGVAGALLAEYVGFDVIFLLSLVIVSMVAVYLLALCKWLDWQAQDGVSSPGCESRPNAQAPNAPEKLERGAIRAFLLDRHVLALVFFASMPAALTAIGLLNYFSPVYLRDSGVNQATIGQILMIYGLCMVFVGPLVSRHITRDQQKRIAVIVGSILGGLGFLAFAVLGGALAVMVAVLLLGLSHSLVLSSQSALLLSLPAAQRLGPGKALGIFRATSRVGQTLGPLAMSGVMLLGGVHVSMPAVGVVYLLCVLGFWIMTRKLEQQDEEAIA